MIKHELVAERDFPRDFYPGRNGTLADICYADLVEVFGEPNAEDDEYKVDASWAIKIGSEYIRLWNFKNGPAYLGEGTTMDDIYSWSLGCSADGRLELYGVLRAAGFWPSVTSL